MKLDNPSKKYKRTRTHPLATLAKIKLVMLAIILSSSLALAGDWTQYTPTPYATQINYIKTIGTTSLAVNSANFILYYNGTNWNEILPPAGIPTHATAYAEKAEDGNYHVLFSKNGTRYETYTYDGQTWTQTDTYDHITSGGVINYKCINNGAGYNGNNDECYIIINHGFNNISFHAVEGATIEPPDVYATGTGTLDQIYSNRQLYIAYHILFAGSLLRFNGITWIGETIIPSATAYTISEYDVNYRIARYSKYNQTSATFNTAFSGMVGNVYMRPDTLGAYGECSSNSSYICKLANYPDVNVSTDTFKGGAQITALDFDENTNTGWLGLSDGKLFSFGGVNTQTTTTTPEQLSYRIYEYTKTDTNITNIEGVVPITQTKTYAIAKKNNKLSIISYDHTNPTDIQTENLTTTSTATPRGIDSVGDVLILATSQNAWVYNNTLTDDVLQLTLVNIPQASTWADNLESVIFGGTGTEAYTCDTTLQDELIKLDTTNNGTINQTTSQTCTDLATDADGDYIYAYEGLNGVKIYNKTLSLVNTMNVVSSVGTNNPRDVLSASGNRLAITTGRNVIKIYDNTNGANPTFEWECRASDDIRSIELLTDQVIIVATTNALQVCNKNDTNLYDTQGQYYITKQLKQDNRARRDIRKTSTPLGFASAETDRFAIYELQIGDLASTNLAPIINSVELATTTACVNETIKSTINAYDPDSPLDLGYAVACDGLTYTSSASPEVYCTYTNTGLKTIRYKVNDAYSNTTTTRSVSVQNCNLTNTTILQITIKDFTTGQPLQNVLINIIGQTSATTNAGGYARLTFPSGTYNYTLSKTNYYTKNLQDTFPSGLNSIFQYLTTSITTNENGSVIQLATITLNVKDTKNNPIYQASTSITDPITNLATTLYTDQLGTATHINVATNTPLRISIGKTGYKSTWTETSVNAGETKTLTITLLGEKEPTNQSTGRGCQDYANNWILCEPLNKTGGNGCTQNSDCLGDRCITTYGTCSNVNWTRCDAEGQDRGSWCATSISLQQTGNALQGMILDNFLYFGLFVIIIILFLIIVSKINNNR